MIAFRILKIFMKLHDWNWVWCRVKIKPESQNYSVGRHHILYALAQILMKNWGSNQYTFPMVVSQKVEGLDPRGLG